MKKKIPPGPEVKIYEDHPKCDKFVILIISLMGVGLIAMIFAGIVAYQGR